MSTDPHSGTASSGFDARRRLGPWLIPLGGWVVYILFFGAFYASFGLLTGVLAFVPVVLTAWRGALAGVVGGLVAVPLTDLLSAAQTGAPLFSWINTPVAIGAVAVVLVGIVVGRMRNLDARVALEIAGRQRVERDLRLREVQLAVTNNIARAMRDGMPTDRIIQATVESLHVHFPHLRSAYSTLSDDGRITVDRSVGPAALASGLAAGGAGAVLDAPVRHSEALVGLLSLDSSTPRRWSAHERSTLREAADFLAVALRAAEATTRLEESERKFRQVAESSQAMIALLQEQGAIYLNPECVRLTEYSHDELMKTRLWDIIHPDDVAMIRASRSRGLADGGTPDQYETRIVTKSGKTRWLDIRASTFWLAGKRTMLTTGLDITERKAWEQGVAESEARLRTLMEHLTDGVGLVVDGRIVYANSALTRLLGYSPDEVAGLRPTDLLVPGDRSLAAQRLSALAEDGAPQPPPVEYEMVRRDGSTVPVLVNTRRIDMDGRPALFSIVRDLTDQRELEEQLRQTQRLESVGQLAGGVAHNFNNALAAIIGYSELIARQLDEQDPVLADVRQILTVAEQSASLTQQLLTFSRKERISPTIFNLNEAIESSSVMLSPLMGDDVQLRLRLDPALHQVRADRRQLEQIIMNLALNARDAMAGDGSITIVTEDVVVSRAQARLYPDAREGGHVRLTVKDTGTGMDRETVARIFEPFFTTKEPGQGVGLGLSMVHGAVKQAAGFVTVESEPGAGTRFDVYLPAHEERVGGLEATDSPPALS
jgi:PAS domain S-box-containing protein